MISDLEFILRLAVAFALGAAVGVERQWRQKSAGLRTNTLVSVGSAAFILLSVSLTGAEGDPSRVASQIVTGIGFLGAGVIMKDGLSVHGLTTAATIWCSAAVGALAGTGLYIQAVFVTTAVIAAHVLLRPLGHKLNKLPYEKTEAAQTDYLFTIKCRQPVENHLRVLLMQYVSNDERLLLRSLTSSDDGDSSLAQITADFISVSPQESLMEDIAGKLTTEPDVLEVKWEVVREQRDV
jgi:putative Mg2+ transporter-C (MgtC) family protein